MQERLAIAAHAHAEPGQNHQAAEGSPKPEQPQGVGDVLEGSFVVADEVIPDAPAFNVVTEDAPIVAEPNHMMAIGSAERDFDDYIPGAVGRAKDYFGRVTESSRSPEQVELDTHRTTMALLLAAMATRQTLQFEKSTRKSAAHKSAKV